MNTSSSARLCCSSTCSASATGNWAGQGAAEVLAPRPVLIETVPGALNDKRAVVQRTADARAPRAMLPQALWDKLGLKEGARVLVQQGTVAQVLPAALDATLAPDAVRIAAGHPDTTALGPMFGLVAVEKA